MKCYYEELGVARTANETDIKSAYRKLALRWHPDKNLQNEDEARERFVAVQQAYEVLSDPHERAWYDNHREQILRGRNSDYEDNCLDLFQYFTVSCFKGFEDNERGFYKTYAEVFERITAEDAEFIENDAEIKEFPKFGDSTSDYETVVGPFYAFWQSYCTKKTYTWLCPHDISEIKDRRILRIVEKDLKKIAQAAKKRRNEEVRNLVSFIRKRDPRVKAYGAILKERTAQNRLKQAANRLEQIRKRNLEVQAAQTSSMQAFNDNYEEQLKLLEQDYSADSDSETETVDTDKSENYDNHSKESSLECDDDGNYIDNLYCIACNRAFTNKRAFANHETSKKHRENIEKLVEEVHEHEAIINSLNNDVSELNGNTEDLTLSDSEVADSKKKAKAKKSKKAKKATQPTHDLTDDDSSQEAKVEFQANATKSSDEEWTTNSKSAKKSKKKKPQKDKPAEIPRAEPQDVQPNTVGEPHVATENANFCAVCHSKFESKNKLFAHLKSTGHSVYLPKPQQPDDERSTKKSRGKRK